MKTPQLLILLLTILAHVASGFPTDRRGQDKHASWDDVNVVAHGLLQLGQGLKEHVDKSKAQMRDINAKLKAFNSTMTELEKKQHEQSEALKARGGEAVVEEREREKMAAELVEEVRVKVEEVKKQSEDMNSRMDRLEEKVDEVLTGSKLDSNNSDETGVPLIQRMVAAQNRQIDQLVEKIKQQQSKLEKQSVHLQALQSKVAHKRVKSHRRRDEERALRGEVEHGRDTSGSARDCHDLYVRGQRASGVYTIQPENSRPFNVLCEMTSEGGWTVIQRRQDGSQSFNQLWESYKRGFGHLNGDFWLGLDNIHSLSKQGQYVLQVEVSNQAGEQHTARYQFQLDGEEKKFALHLEQQENNASGPEAETIMTTGASGLPFSTADRDSDLSAEVNCAEQLSGGWWFSSCGESNLNGRYPRRPSLLRRHQTRRQVMFWSSSKGPNNSLKTTLLKIAPATIKQ